MTTDQTSKQTNRRDMRVKWGVLIWNNKAPNMTTHFSRGEGEKRWDDVWPTFLTPKKKIEKKMGFPWKLKTKPSPGKGCHFAVKRWAANERRLYTSLLQSMTRPTDGMT